MTRIEMLPAAKDGEKWERWIWTTPTRRILLAAIAGSLLGCAAPSSRNQSTAQAPSPRAPHEETPHKQPVNETSYANPILPGFYPDPSICRVGEDYYIVTSTFEYFPGVPIFHSKDLVNWRQIGHVLTRPGQLPLAGVKSSKGIFAPTLRYHEGTFFMITTNMEAGGSFFVTAKDPAGPWSDPIWLQEEMPSMDPSLFFDDDGTVYYTRHGGGRHGAIFQQTIDLSTGELSPPAPRKLWEGTGDIWPEGPHLYKKDGVYYLMISEGGTSYEHMVTIARSNSPWGPFESHPRNPIITHRYKPKHSIQAVGHSDFVTTPDGHWFMTLLAIRPSVGKFHHLGRETYLVPVTWKEGWPVVNGGKPVEERTSALGLPSAHLWPTQPSQVDFNAPLGFEWNYLRNPDMSAYSLSERPGTLRLKGSEFTLDDRASPTFVGRRQRVYNTKVSVEVEFAPTQEGQEAGLVVRSSEDNHYDLLIQKKGKQRVVVLRTKVLGGNERAEVKVQAQVAVSDGPLQLSIVSKRETWEFFVTEPGKDALSLGTAPTQPFSSEYRIEFTGAYYGLYASSGGKKTTNIPPADFNWFEYIELD